MAKKHWCRLIAFLNIIPFMIQAMPAARAAAYFEKPSDKSYYAINELAGKKFYGALGVIEIINHKKWHIPFETSPLKVASASDDIEVIYDFNIMQTFNRHVFDNFSFGSKVQEWYIYQNNLNEEANNAHLFACLATMLQSLLFRYTCSSPSPALKSLWAKARKPRANLPHSGLALKLRKRPAPSGDHDNSYHVSLSGLLQLPGRTQVNLNATSAVKVRFTRPEALKTSSQDTVHLLPIKGTTQTGIYHLKEIILFPSENKNGSLYRSSDFIPRDEL